MLEVKANIPLNNKAKIDAACRLLERFKPDEPVAVRVFTDTCVTVSAKYSFWNAIKFKHYVRKGNYFVKGFNVILAED